MNQSSTLLHISASPRGALSFSTKLGKQLARQISAKFPQLELVECDLGKFVPAAPNAVFAAENLMPLDAREKNTLSDWLIHDLEAAGAVIITTPMHNFGIPVALKAWVDQVVRPLRTFERTSQGKRGLLADRPTYIIVTCGGPVTGPFGQADFLTPYLEYVLPTIGLRDISLILLDSMNRNDEHTNAQLTVAEAWITEQVAKLSNVA